jgi:hypothetical protein
MQNRVPCLLEDRLRIERNGQEIVCPSRQCDSVALGPSLPKPAHGDGQASPEQMLCATLCPVSCIGSNSPSHTSARRRPKTPDRHPQDREADELGFELPLQYLDQLASKIAYENDKNVRKNHRIGFLAGVAD